MKVLRRAREGDFVEHLLEAALTGSGLSPTDRHLCQELLYGIVRRQATLDWLVARKTGARPQHPDLLNLLRLGLYQIFWLDRIPPHAAVNETVELARKVGFGPKAGFVNAVLRGYLREEQATREALQRLKLEQPHLGYSHPEWLCHRWQQRWGNEQACELMRWNNTPPLPFARVNTLKTTAEKLLPQWRQEGVDYDFVRNDWLEENVVFKLKSFPPLERMLSFQQGLFYIQDPSTLLSVAELNPQAGERVLDLCAAPGGKLTYIAQRMANQGTIHAFDPSPERLNQVRQNCSRLGVTCVEIVGASGLGLGGPYNRVLVDAPCSNTGVMRRRVDLRWRLRAEELRRLQGTQLELLHRAAGFISKGGCIIYSTCSLETEENQEVVRQFLKENSRFKLLVERELLPFLNQTDGAYVARLSG